MISAIEIKNVNDAIAEADAKVKQMESMAGFDWTFGMFASVDQREAKASRETLEMAIFIRNQAIETEDHELMLMAYEWAKDIADPGWQARTHLPTLTEQISKVGGEAKQTVITLYNKAVDTASGIIPSATWIKITIIVVGLLALAYLGFKLPRFSRAKA